MMSSIQFNYSFFILLYSEHEQIKFCEVKVYKKLLIERLLNLQNLRQNLWKASGLTVPRNIFSENVRLNLETLAIV